MRPTDRRTDGRTPRPASARAAVLAAALLAVAAPLAAQDYPTRPPAPMPLRPVRFPPFATSQLPNGMSTIVVRNNEQPVVTISLSVPAGGRYVPADKAGLDDMVASLITKGTATRTADQIAEEIEGAGGSIGAGAGADNLTITVSALSENLEPAMRLLADVAMNAAFPETEVELARTQMLSGLQLELSQPGAIADRAFAREVYGAHPYGLRATPASVRGITREDITAYHAARVRPRGALLVVAGDVDPARVRSLARSAFAAWTGAPAAAAAAPALPVRTATEIVLVHKPGAVQSNLVAGFPFITPRNPALYPLTLANRILGDGSDSRLFLILREQRSWTYGAYSGFSQPYGTGTFRATAEVRTEVTDSALAELIAQLRRIRTETPPDSEITAARNYITGSFPLTIETPEQVAGAVANARLRGQPDDFVMRYRERVAAVTPAAMMAAARRYITPDRMLVVVVGDGQRIHAPLRALGYPVRIVSTDGTPMTENDLRPSTTGPAWEPSRIRAGTDRYRILVQGNPFGEEIRTLTRVQDDGRDAWQMITATTLGPIVTQHDTTTFEPASLRPIRVRQGGRVQGTETFVRLDYAGGRVRGSSRTPSRPGQPPNEHAVDTTVTDATLDDNQVAGVLPALPYAPGARFTMPVFSGGENALKTYTVAVIGEETVTVPGGTFACWKVEVTGATTPVTFYIARDTPRIIKLELSGAPLAFEYTGSN